MNFRFQNLLGAPYRGGNAVISNNTLLLSPVGNRVSVTDLRKSETTTLPIQSSSNISRIAVSPDGTFLLAIDDNNRCLFINLRRIAVSPDGTFLLAIDDNNRCLFINLRRRALLHRITFKHRVGAVKFSPDGGLIAVGAGKLVQIWRSPAFRREFFPFELVRTFADFHSKITAFDWSPDSNYLLVASKDLTARILCLKKLKGGAKYKPFLFLGHRDSVVGEDEYSSAPSSPGTPERELEGDLMNVDDDGDVKKRKRKMNELEFEDGGYLCKGKWALLRKDCFNQAPAKMPDFVCIHLLSISKEKITTALFNDLGNWLSFGCAKLGQLLVWEWRSESYILKQQGHYFDVNCVAYSPDSQLLATGADDNKVKVWTVSSGFCFVTFTEHTNAVTALHFMASNNCLLSASLDGTVRAWDLLRYRNFRIFTTPSSRQFVSLAAVQSGEVICAGTSDSFEIFVWSMRNGQLLDVLSGHEAPVHGLVFSPTNGVLASSSWDKTVRLWDVFDGKGTVETWPHSHDVLTVVYRPDGRQVACSTLDGQIHFWDPIDGLLMYTIEGSRDIAGGRLMTDRRTAANKSTGKFFTTLCYSADGSYILAGGSSRYICMYDVADQ
ncbi:periodic tryptophan protein 2, partial [Trifolium pratense]